MCLSIIIQFLFPLLFVFRTMIYCFYILVSFFLFICFYEYLYTFLCPPPSLSFPFIWLGFVLFFYISLISYLFSFYFSKCVILFFVMCYVLPFFITDILHISSSWKPIFIFFKIGCIVAQKFIPKIFYGKYLMNWLISGVSTVTRFSGLKFSAWGTLSQNYSCSLEHNHIFLY